MKTEAFSPNRYIENLKKVLAQWQSDVVRHAWVLTFVDDESEHASQAMLLQQAWEAVITGVTLAHLSKGLRKFEEAVCAIFLQTNPQNNVISNLDSELRRHCVKKLRRQMSCWQLQAIPSSNVFEAEQSEVYASVQLTGTMMQALEAKLSELKSRNSAIISMPWWNTSTRHQSIRFIEAVLTLNAANELTAAALKTVFNDNIALLDAYFDGMAELYKNLENSLKKEIVNRARLMPGGPVIALENNALVQSFAAICKSKSIYTHETNKNETSQQSGQADRHYYYDVFDNDHQGAEKHTHSIQCAKKQKHEYARKVVAEQRGLQLSEMVSLRSSLCCMHWKYGQREPSALFQSKTSQLADALERELEEAVWKLSCQGGRYA